MNTSIWWIRRDLRLSDNQALAAALEQSRTVIPVFILDTRLLASSYMSQKRLAFLFDGLRALNDSLRQRGGALIVRHGDPLEVLHGLRNETGANVCTQRLSGRQRERRTLIAKRLPGATQPSSAGLGSMNSAVERPLSARQLKAMSNDLLTAAFDGATANHVTGST